MCASSSHAYFREVVLHVSSPCLELSPAQLAMGWVNRVCGGGVDGVLHPCHQQVL